MTLHYHVCAAHINYSLMYVGWGKKLFKVNNSKKKKKKKMSNQKILVLRGNSGFCHLK